MKYLGEWSSDIVRSCMYHRVGIITVTPEVRSKLGMILNVTGNLLICSGVLLDFLPSGKPIYK